MSAKDALPIRFAATRLNLAMIIMISDGRVVCLSFFPTHADMFHYFLHTITNSLHSPTVNNWIQ